MQRAAVDVGQAALLAPNLSLDEPMNEFVPWRWFCSAGWLSTAVMSATTELPSAPARTPEPEATL
jgi:hypothetical protein